VPLDGPGSLAGLAPGLHERLTARSTPQLPSPQQPAPQQPSPQQPSPQLPSAQPPAPWATGTPTTAPTPPPRRHPVLGTVLLIASALSLSGAIALGWAALG
jgi:serine/threonine-protein kinase